ADRARGVARGAVADLPPGAVRPALGEEGALGRPLRPVLEPGADATRAIRERGARAQHDGAVGAVDAIDLGNGEEVHFRTPSQRPTYARRMPSSARRAVPLPSMTMRPFSMT